MYWIKLVKNTTYHELWYCNIIEWKVQAFKISYSDFFLNDPLQNIPIWWNILCKGDPFKNRWNHSWILFIIFLMFTCFYTGQGSDFNRACQKMSIKTLGQTLKIRVEKVSGNTDIFLCPTYFTTFIWYFFFQLPSKTWSNIMNTLSVSGLINIAGENIAWKQTSTCLLLVVTPPSISCILQKIYVHGQY